MTFTTIAQALAFVISAVLNLYAFIAVFGWIALVALIIGFFVLGFFGGMLDYFVSASRTARNSVRTG